MMHSDLQSFTTLLQNGALENLKVGMVIDEVLDYAGLPDNFKSVEQFYTALPGLRQTDASENSGIVY
ncbi:MAG: hypothetical protein ACPG7F_12730, partial [Aggregatilineales bacterium]